MGIHNPPSANYTTEDLVAELIDNSLSIIRRLLPEVARITASIREAPPTALLEALRSPVGPPIYVNVLVMGKGARVVVYPQGVIDPPAEQRAWRCICDQVLRRGEAA